jgi:hypothetical protein
VLPDFLKKTQFQQTNFRSINKWGSRDLKGVADVCCVTATPTTTNNKASQRQKQQNVLRAHKNQSGGGEICFEHGGSVDF